MFYHPNYYKELAKEKKKLEEKLKRQAPSNKLLYLGSSIKFWKLGRGIINHDKSILWMFNMECYLMWRKFNLVCFCIF